MSIINNNLIAIQEGFQEGYFVAARYNKKGNLKFKKIGKNEKNKLIKKGYRISYTYIEKKVKEYINENKNAQNQNLIEDICKAIEKRSKKLSNKTRGLTGFLNALRFFSLSQMRAYSNALNKLSDTIKNLPACVAIAGEPISEVSVAVIPVQNQSASLPEISSGVAAASPIAPSSQSDGSIASNNDTNAPLPPPPPIMSGGAMPPPPPPMAGASMGPRKYTQKKHFDNEPKHPELKEGVTSLTDPYYKKLSEEELKREIEEFENYVDKQNSFLLEVKAKLRHVERNEEKLLSLNISEMERKIKECHAFIATLESALEKEEIVEIIQQNEKTGKSFSVPFFPSEEVAKKYYAEHTGLPRDILGSAPSQNETEKACSRQLITTILDLKRQELQRYEPALNGISTVDSEEHSLLLAQFQNNVTISLPENALNAREFLKNVGKNTPTSREEVAQLLKLDTTLLEYQLTSLGTTKKDQLFAAKIQKQIEENKNKDLSEMDSQALLKLKQEKYEHLKKMVEMYEPSPLVQEHADNLKKLQEAPKTKENLISGFQSKYHVLVAKADQIQSKSKISEKEKAELREIDNQIKATLEHLETLMGIKKLQTWLLELKEENIGKEKCADFASKVQEADKLLENWVRATDLRIKALKTPDSAKEEKEAKAEETEQSSTAEEKEMLKKRYEEIVRSNPVHSLLQGEFSGLAQENPVRFAMNTGKVVDLNNLQIGRRFTKEGDTIRHKSSE